MTIRKAKVTEAKQIKSILDNFAGKGLLLSRSMDEIYSSIRDFTVCEMDNKVVGVCALAIFTDEFAEIRSLAVLDSYRNKKIGAFLVQACIAEAMEYDIKQVFTLTYIKDFFSKLKFQIISKDYLPHKIWRDCISCEHFYHCDEEALIHTID